MLRAAGTANAAMLPTTRQRGRRRCQSDSGARESAHCGRTNHSHFICRGERTLSALLCSLSLYRVRWRHSLVELLLTVLTRNAAARRASRASLLNVFRSTLARSHLQCVCVACVFVRARVCVLKIGNNNALLLVFPYFFFDLFLLHIS